MTLLTSRGGGCPVCGAQHVSCGPATTTVGVDERIKEATTVGELREYKVTVNGHETTMQLNDADAEQLGVKQPSRKADEPEEKARTAQNKSRTTESK